MVKILTAANRTIIQWTIIIFPNLFFQVYFFKSLFAEVAKLGAYKWRLPEPASHYVEKIHL
jgi:hypothetical protein